MLLFDAATPVAAALALLLIVAVLAVFFHRLSR